MINIFHGRVMFVSTPANKVALMEYVEFVYDDQLNTEQD